MHRRTPNISSNACICMIKLDDSTLYNKNENPHLLNIVFKQIIDLIITYEKNANEDTQK